MRSVGATITTAERAVIVDPLHAATAQNELLSFSAFASTSNASLDSDLAPTYVMFDAGVSAYATFRYTSGASYLRAINSSAATDYQLSSSSSTSLTTETMRHGLINDGGTIRLYTTNMSSGGAQVQRASLSGGTNPITATLANYGPAFGDALASTATLVRRCEATCPTAGGVVVCIGTHNFTLGLSTLQFYLLPDSASVVPLNTMIQMPLTETYASFYATARYASMVSAVYDATAKRIIVVASDQVRGRAVTFSIQNGVESALRPVVPIDPDASTIALMPYSISSIGGTFYLTARFSRTASSQYTTAFDCILTSADGINWSFGSRTFFVSQTDGKGTLIMRNDSPTVVVYAGNNTASTAQVTELQSSASTLSTILDDYIADWSLSQVANGADKLGMMLIGPVQTGGGMAFDNDPSVARGSVVYLKSGQGSTLADIGAYGIDEVAQSVSVSGREVTKISARDYGNKRLIDTAFPVAMSFESRITASRAMSSLNDLSIKTPPVDVTADSVNGWTFSARNDPLIAYCDANDGGDALMKATVKASGADENHLASVGFVFGASQTGAGNVLMIPKTSTWDIGSGAQTKPVVRALNLNSVDPANPKAADTGWNFSTNVNSLWQSVQSGGARTAAVSAPTPRTQSTWSMTPGTTYDIAARVVGRRVQLFQKTHVTSSSTWATNADYTLVGEFLFDSQSRRVQSSKNYCGLALGQDVWVDLPAFAQSPYDDIEQSLTTAGNYAALSDFTQYSQACTSWNVPTERNKISVANGALYTVGQYIRVYFSAAGYNNRHRISSISGGILTLTENFGLGVAASANGDVYTPSFSYDWGFADCGKRVATASGVRVVTDPGAEKRPRQILGRAAFVSDDSTAVSIRYVRSDGVRLLLSSGAESGSRVGWDYGANPIAQEDDSFYYAGSSPNAWRVVFHHGYMFNVPPESVYLPATGYVDVENECIRYAGVTFKRRDMSTDATWTIVPTYYAPLQAAGATSSIKNWKQRSSTSVVGDDFRDIPNPLGMLVEISSRNGGKINGDKQYYVTGVDTTAPTAGTDNAPAISLDKQYENGIVGTDTVTLAGNGDIAIISGRGQFGTTKKTHESGTPVRYSPRTVSGDGLTGTLPDIRVSAWDCFSGPTQTLEDMVARMCSVAGVHNAAFRNRFTTPASPVSAALGTSAYTLPLDSTLANFTLDARVHIPGNSTNSFGQYANANALKIGFRGYYMLYVQQYAGTVEYALGRPGVIRVGLATTSTDIAAASDGVRWLELATIPVTDYNMAGTTTVSGSAYTLTEDVARLVDLRVCVQGGIVSVEINGAPIWTFNLDRYTNGTTSWRKDTPGNITLAYALSIASYTASIRVQELGEEVARYTAPLGTSVSAAINAISQTRRMRTRAGINGAVEFSRFTTRDDAGSLSENLWQDAWSQSDLVQRGHQLVAGSASGEYIDTSIIAAEGYKFGSTTSNSVSTSEDATNEAKLLMREAAEFQETRGVDGVGLLEVQPEDKITLVYGGTDDAPQHESSTHVVTSVSLKAGVGETTGSYTLRRYIA